MSGSAAGSSRRRVGVRDLRQSMPATWDDVLGNLFLRTNIFSFLDWRDLIMCESVSASWYGWPSRIGRGALWRNLFSLYFSLHPINQDPTAAATVEGPVWRQMFFEFSSRPECVECGQRFERGRNSSHACRVANSERDGGGWHVPRYCPSDINPNQTDILVLATCVRRRDLFLFFYPPSTHHVLLAVRRVLDELSDAVKDCEEFEAAGGEFAVRAARYPFGPVVVQYRQSQAPSVLAFLGGLSSMHLRRIISSPDFS
eukprot:TRINITY_DN73259_c0_g1_i1.p1 TRINITY_DN73259_c0_g1~~TRINITY_DN73259_c0_g1_i1.p1  ORF type:complete len:285 (-),score=20.46 TRINITY_DN73259_c0_g1_i1:54-824(-)